ncbi:hypothetical protein [uncultured Sphingomonas sp.]|uniref:hypothetical protein n=1 Tax=uncultured Sphingomonas sp. TaxID=158754 RepID=UPI0035CAD7FB
MIWLASILAFVPAATRVTTSHGATIWPTGSFSHIKLCSRAVPAPIEGEWQPTWRDIERAERSLPNTLRAWRIHHDPDSLVSAAQFGESNWQSRWSRNYFGIVRAKRRLLYIDFAPRSYRDGFGVCDGFPVFFGIEYDPVIRSIVALSTNGIA